jgi:light-regulated signal transduction histidine kinase (bacteriophytochrome)
MTELQLYKDALRQNTLQRDRDVSHAAELSALNAELEAFSYSVSHDLRAPLRHIHGYVEMLRSATDGTLSAKAGRYLQTIGEASLEMGELIDDLLAFSRVGRSDLTMAPIDLADLIHDVIGSLEMATVARTIVWNIGPMPRVIADVPLLRRVLVNLIDNAIKYTGTRASATIEIGCGGEEDGRVILFVRDNGVGFDMRYAHKLFSVFQRLHRVEDFEGTGIGLATVRRIVGRHGGRVWAEGVLNEGATFFLTLELAPLVTSTDTPQ